MENKIEISEPEHNVAWWQCTITVDGVHEHNSFGNTAIEAQQNARIAASGYLVEELVEKGTELTDRIDLILNNSFDSELERLNENLKQLLTKAKTV